MRRLLSPKVIEAVLERTLARIDVKTVRDDRARLECELSRLDRELAHLTSAIAGGAADVSVIVAGLKERQGRRADVAARLSALEAMQAPSSLTQKDRQKALRARLEEWRQPLTQQHGPCPTTPQETPRGAILGIPCSGR
jgi:hypothetical protein